MNDRVKAMLLTITKGAFGGLREAERPGSSRDTRLGRGEDRIDLMIDAYRPEAWPEHALRLADGLLDEFNRMIRDELGNDVPPAMIIHTGLAACESVRARETGALRKRLDNGVDRLLELVEPWDIDSLPPRMVAVAGRLGDVFTRRVTEVLV